jgi:hypothetical protein
MAVTLLNNFPDVQKFISDILTQNGDSGLPNASPHKAFWSTMTYDQFVNGNVPNTSAGGHPIPILKIGDSASSNIILALSGAGPIFGSTGSAGIMPPDGEGTQWTTDQVKSIANWIDAGCPNPLPHASFMKDKKQLKNDRP